MTIWSDDYNRANETPLATGTWGQSGTGSFNLASNQVSHATDANDNEVYYVAATAIGDQFSQAKITALGSGETGVGVCCRHIGTSTRTFIRAIADDGGTITVRCFAAGVSGSTATRTGTFAANDILRLEVSGTSPNIVAKVFKNGVQVGADITGLTGPNTGKPGLAYSSTPAGTTSLDDWSGGDLVQAVAAAMPFHWPMKLSRPDHLLALPMFPKWQPVYFPTAVGGTTFPQDLTATVSSVSLIQMQVNKLLNAAVTSLAFITKQVNKNLSATATSSGTITKRVNKNISAPATTTASIRIQVNKLLTAPATVTASITKQINKLLSATATTTPSVQKQVNKNLTGNVTVSGSVIKTALKNITATVTSTASIQALKVILLTLTAGVSSLASIQRQVNKLMETSNSLSASIQKQVNKPMTAGASVTASLTALKVILQTLTAGVSSTASITRQVNKVLIAPVTVVGIVTKLVKKTLTALSSVIGVLTAHSTAAQVARRVLRMITIGRF